MSVVLVTPHTGVWIETRNKTLGVVDPNVTPHTGVWIETFNILIHEFIKGSRPTRACGLKPNQQTMRCYLAGRHAPHGRVD